MKLTNKLVVFGCLFFVLMSCIGGFAYWNVNSVRQVVHDLAQQMLPVESGMNEINVNQLHQSVWLERLLNAIQSGDVRATEKSLEQFNYYTDKNQADYKALGSALDALDAENLDASILAQLRRIRSDLEELRISTLDFKQTAEDLLRKVQATGAAQSDLELTSLATQADTLSVSIANLGKDLTKVTRPGVLAAEDDISSLIINMIIVCVFAVALMLGSAVFLTRTVFQQLGADPARLADIAGKVAAGKLNLELEKTRIGVYASLVSIVESLREVIGGIQMGADEVSQASAQMDKGNTNLSQRTQEQASSLEEVAASMEQMTSTVNQNASNAQQAHKMALEAREQAVQGGEVVGKTVSAMNDINSASRKISDIIGVIDDIAFQTNLLALNAAVEAARAGEQGRGFAVVAGEVRSLAGRSATAAKEIKELILDTVRKVEDGVRLVDDSGKKLEEIVNSVKKVSDNVAEIATASQEQSEGISQVNKAVLQMDDMTQENASLVEQAAAASETVDAQARELKELVAFFQIGSTHEPHSSSPDQNRFKLTPAISKQKADAKEASFKAEKLLSKKANAYLKDDSDWEEF